MNDALTNYRLSKLREGFADQALAAAVSGAVRLPVAPRSRSPGSTRSTHPGVLGALVTELDVPAAVALALDEGAGAAAYLLDVLKLRSR